MLANRKRIWTELRTRRSSTTRSKEPRENGATGPSAKAPRLKNEIHQIAATTGDVNRGYLEEPETQPRL